MIFLFISLLNQMHALVTVPDRSFARFFEPGSNSSPTDFFLAVVCAYLEKDG